MDFFDAIRGFFGLPYRNDGTRNRPGFRNPIMGEDSDDDDDDILDDDYRFNDRQNHFGFNIFSGDILEMHRFFEQQFDEIVRNFQSNWNFPEIEGPKNIPGIQEPHTFDDNPRSKFVKPEYLEPLPNPKPHTDGHIDSSPRHRFLRPAYVEPPLDPHAKKDTDIDNKLDPSQVLDLFPDKNSGNKQIEPYSSRKQSHFSSQVIKKRMLPNGGIEEERKRLTNGTEEVCVSRQLGDMKHVTTTIKHPDGTTEKKEEFINFDEDKLSDFNKAWGISTSQNFQKPNDTGEIIIPNKFSLFDIFSKFIP